MIELPKMFINNIFNSQEDVDKYVMETEKLAEEVDNEDTAIQLYKHISYLKAASELFFVPEIIFGWEEMALSYIESLAALFECVYYEQIVIVHKQGFDIFNSLEQDVLNNLISLDQLFIKIYAFNLDIQEFNKYCKKYHQKQLNYYKCNNKILEQRYQLWLAEEGL